MSSKDFADFSPHYEQYFMDRLRSLGKGPKKISADEVGALCPFHEETTPSFNVNIKTGKCFCHSCHEKLNMISFHAKTNDTDNKTAYRDLCKMYGLDPGGKGNGNGNGHKGRSTGKSKSNASAQAKTNGT